MRYTANKQRAISQLMEPTSKMPPLLSSWRNRLLKQKQTSCKSYMVFIHISILGNLAEIRYSLITLIDAFLPEW